MIPGNGHDSSLDDPAAATLLDRASRALAELARTVTALVARGIDPVRLTATIGTALPAGKNVFHVLGALAADAECRPGEERYEATPSPRAATAGARVASRSTRPRHKRRCSW